MKVNKGGRRRLMGLAYVGRWIESQWHKMSVNKGKWSWMN